MRAPFSRISSGFQTVIAKALRERLGLKLGDLVRYVMGDRRAVSERAKFEADPFATFDEWQPKPTKAGMICFDCALAVVVIASWADGRSDVREGWSVQSAQTKLFTFDCVSCLSQRAFTVIKFSIAKLQPGPRCVSENCRCEVIRRMHLI